MIMIESGSEGRRWSSHHIHTMYVRNTQWAFLRHLLPVPSSSYGPVLAYIYTYQDGTSEIRRFHRRFVCLGRLSTNSMLWCGLVLKIITTHDAQRNNLRNARLPIPPPHVHPQSKALFVPHDGQKLLELPRKGRGVFRDRR